MSEQNEKLMTLFPWRTVGMRVADTLRILSDAESDGFGKRDDMLLVDTYQGRLKFDQERVRQVLMQHGPDYTRALRHSGAHDIVLEEFVSPHSNSARQPLARTWVGPANVVVSRVTNPSLSANLSRLGWEAYGRRLRYSRLAESSAQQRAGTTSTHRGYQRAGAQGTTGTVDPAGGPSGTAGTAGAAATAAGAESSSDGAAAAPASEAAEDGAAAGANGADSVDDAATNGLSALPEGTVRETGLEDVVCNEYVIIPEIFEFKDVDGGQWVRMDEGSPWKAGGPPLMLLYRVSMVTSAGSLLPPPAQLHEMIVFVKAADSRRVTMVAQRCWVEEGPGMQSALRVSAEPVLREVQQGVLRRFLGELANIASGSGSADVEAKADMAVEDDDLDDQAKATRLAEAELAEGGRKQSQDDPRGATPGSALEGGEGKEDHGGAERGSRTSGQAGESLGAQADAGEELEEEDAKDEAALLAAMKGLASLKGASPADRMRALFLEEELLRVAAKNAHVRARARVNRLARQDKARRHLNVISALARVAGRLKEISRAAEAEADLPIPELEGEDDSGSDEEESGRKAAPAAAGRGSDGRAGRPAVAGGAPRGSGEAALTFECDVGVPDLWRRPAKEAEEEVPEVDLPAPWVPGMMVPAVGDEDLSESMSDQAWGRFCSVDMLGWGSVAEDTETQAAFAAIQREQERRAAALATVATFEELAKQKEAEAAAEDARQEQERTRQLTDKHRMPGESAAASLARQLAGTAAPEAPDVVQPTSGDGGGDKSDSDSDGSADQGAPGTAKGEEPASPDAVGDGSADAADAGPTADAADAGPTAGAEGEQALPGAEPESPTTPGGPQAKDSSVAGGDAGDDEKVWAVPDDGDIDWEPPSDTSSTAEAAGGDSPSGNAAAKSEATTAATTAAAVPDAAATAVAVLSATDDCGASTFRGGEDEDEDDEFDLRQPTVLGIPHDTPTGASGRLTGDRMVAAIVLGAERRQLAQEQARLRVVRAAREEQLAKEREARAKVAAQEKAQAEKLASIPAQDSLPVISYGHGVDEEDEMKLKLAASNDPSLRACSTEANCVCM